MAAFETIQSVDHPLAADYVALNDPVRRRQVERDGNYFVVEGVLAIERLLELGTWDIRSLLLLPRVADRLANELASLDVTVGVAEPAVLESIVGFDIHRGALASVERRVGATLDDLITPGATLLLAEGVNDHENLGALYRNAAAFGVTAIVLDPRCADPFYRRSIRVSLGNVLAIPTVRSGPLPSVVENLHRFGFRTMALTPRGDTDLWSVPDHLAADDSVALLVGAEGPGLTDETLAAASHRVRIDMATDVDSLNVATAAAVALHHLRHR